VRLPAARTADVNFSQVLDEQGTPIDDGWKTRRRDALLKLFGATAPDAVITEMYPFGRRPFRFELLPLLEAAKAASHPPVVAASVRDVLVKKDKPRRAEEAVEIVRRFYDLVLVHSDPKLIRFEASFPDAAAIAGRLRYTGYVTEAALADGTTDRSRGEILVSAGGGAVGMPLLQAAMAARPLSKQRGRRWRIIAGANLPGADYAALAARSGEGIVLERFRSDFRALLAQCRVSVSQGGYNTVMEILASRTPAVIVPFAEGAESEQTDRARLLAEKGLLHLVPPDALTPERLAAAIDTAAQTTAPEIPIDFDGARHTAAAILGAVAARG
jgi:predicted glycosyltransferase